jgi:DNA-binding transcriptional ArsR family regulator
MGRSAADRAAPAGAHRAAPASAGGAVAAGARDSRTDAHRDSVLVFAALGDKTRLDLVTRLCAGGPLSITRLSAGTEVTRQAITKHLNTLAEAGLVRDIWAGRERLWEVQPGGLEEARRCLERISGQWDEALARLKGAVEREEH